MNPEAMLGMTAQDNVTQVTGTVTAVCLYLNGDTHVRLEMVADNQPIERWLPINRVTVRES